jgi:hypothetical protein
VDSHTQAVTLEPHPDSAVHPLTHKRALAAARRRAEAEAAGLEPEETDEEEDYSGALEAAQLVYCVKPGALSRSFARNHKTH